MKNTIIIEAILIIALIVLICVIPSNHRVDYEETSVAYEHFGRKAALENMQASSADKQEDNKDLSDEDDSSTKTIVAISRPKGGYAAYEDGSFVEPEPDTENDSDDKTGNEDGGSTEDDNIDNEGDDLNSGVSDDEDDTGGGSEDGGDFNWDLKDPTKAIDSGKRATLTAPLKLRSTPTISTESNVIDMLSEGDVLVVTEVSVSSTDPDVPLWVEVYYKGQIGYLSAKYCRVE